MVSGQSPSPKPSVIILRGDDSLAMQRAVSEMIARISPDPGMADLNLTRLDGRTASEEELRTATGSLPFLADRRLVVLTYPLARMSAEAARERFITLLDSLPETTALVLLVEDELRYRRGEKEWDTLKGTHWLMRWAQKAGTRALVRDCLQPRGAEMAGWLREEAKRQGGQLSPAGARALAELTGSDTLQASQELTKLLIYVNYERAVEADDVALLCAPGGQANLYNMLDTIVEGNAQLGLRLLHRLLEDQDAQAIFPQVLRHFRMLIMAREVLDEHGGEQLLVKDGGIPAWQAEKLIRQARRFTMAELVAIHRRLLDMDLDSKTSAMPLELALDTFIVQLAA